MYKYFIFAFRHTQAKYHIIDVTVVLKDARPFEQISFETLLMRAMQCKIHAWHADFIEILLPCIYTPFHLLVAEKFPFIHLSLQAETYALRKHEEG